MDDQEQEQNPSPKGLITQEMILPGQIKPRHLAQVSVDSAGYLYYSDSTNFAALAPGSSGQVLTISSGLPSWATPSIGSVATQADQETGTSVVAGVTPGRQQYHPSAAKAYFYATGATWAIQRSTNISSVTDNGAGDFTVNFTTAFSDTNYSWGGGLRPTAGGNPHYVILVENKDATTRTASALRMYCLNTNSLLAVDVDNVGMVFFGDQ